MKPLTTGLIAAVLLVSCGEQIDRDTTSPAALFRDASRTSDLPTETWGRSKEPRAILEVKGGGVGLFDFNKDGLLDIFLPGGKSLDENAPGPEASLWRNAGHLRFEQIDTKLTWHGWAMGVSAGDLDGNGFDDLFVACYGPNALFLNRSGERLEEAGSEAGLDDKAWGMASALADFDGDGDLDIYLVNYLELDLDALPPDIEFQDERIFAGPLGLVPAADRIFENLGDGKFEDKTFRSGIGVAPKSFGLGATALDFDSDGALDIFVGNDSMANFLFENQGELYFKDVALAEGLAANGDGRRQATMGIAVSDVNGDGAPDVFSTNFAADTNTLLVSRSGKAWRDRTATMGLTSTGQVSVGWASLFGDFDFDGDEDLAIFNGHVYPDRLARKLGSTAAQAALLFERKEKRFEVTSKRRAGDWLASGHIDRGGARADLDSDGDLELVVKQWRGPLRILEGLAANGQKPWLSVHLKRTDVGDRHGYGSRVELTEQIGNETIRRTGWVQTTMGFQSSGTAAVHFALTPKAIARSLVVTWPDGLHQELELDDFQGQLSVTR